MSAVYTTNAIFYGSTTIKWHKYNNLCVDINTMCCGVLADLKLSYFVIAEKQSHMIYGLEFGYQFGEINNGTVI